MRSCLWSFGCGVLLALSFPKFNLAAFAWIAPGLILYCAKERRRTFWIGFCAGIGHYGVSLYWLLLNPIRVYGMASWISVVGVLAMFVGLWCWLCCRFVLKPVASNVKSSFHAAVFFGPLFCAVAWVAMEMIIARFLTGFPWNLLAASQHQFLPLIQIASITGIYGVSFLVVWFSAALVSGPILLRKEYRVKDGFIFLASPALVLIAVLVWGFQQANVRDTSSTFLKIALVQPAIPQPVIWDAAQETNRFDQLISLSKEALETKPQILVWPENALPKMMSRLNSKAVGAINELAKTHQVWMLLGATDFALIKKENLQETNRLNSVFLVDPKGELAGRYFKRHLVPFGEYMPFREWIPKLDQFRKSGRSLTAGKNPVIFQLHDLDVRIASSICFEDVFPHLVRPGENEKADLLFNLTNDGWFGDSAAQWQHAASAMFRAVENGVPLVRCANNGITCWIDERGRWHEVAFEDGRSVYSSGFKLAKIPIAPNGQRPPTFYRQFGDWFGWSCVVLTPLLAWFLHFLQGRAIRK